MNPLRLAVPAEMLQEHFHLEPISAFKIKPGSCRKNGYWLVGLSNLDSGLEFTFTFDKSAARRRAFGMIEA